MRKPNAVDEWKTSEDSAASAPYQVIRAKGATLRVSAQLYEPATRRYREVSGSAIRLRFNNADDAISYALELGDKLEDME